MSPQGREPVRERLHDGLSIARVRVEVKRSLRPLVVIAGAAALTLVLVFYILSHVAQDVYTSHFTVRFAVADATAVVPGRDEVRYKGIPAGMITGASVIDGQPVLTAEVYSKYGPIYRNASAELRPNTPLEDMYLDIVSRGTPAAGNASSGQPIAASQTQTSVDVADVLQVFTPSVRARLATLLDQLGVGLNGRGYELRNAFVQLVPFVTALSGVTNQLSAVSSYTRGLVHNFTLLTGELGRRQSDLRTLVTAGGTTLQTLAASSSNLNETLYELPPTLVQVRTSFVALRSVLGDVNTAVTTLGPIARELPAGLTAVREFSTHADPAVRALDQPIHRLVPLSQTLPPLSNELAASLTNLRPQLGAVDHITSSLADCTLALYGFFQWTASVTKFNDALGTFPRGDGVFSLESAGGVAHDSNEFPADGCMRGSPKGGTP